MQSWSDAVRKAMRDRGLSVDDVARESGVPRRAVENVIVGDLDATLNQLGRIATELRINVDLSSAPPSVTESEEPSFAIVDTAESRFVGQWDCVGNEDQYGMPFGFTGVILRPIAKELRQRLIPLIGSPFFQDDASEIVRRIVHPYTRVIDASTLVNTSQIETVTIRDSRTFTELIEQIEARTKPTV